MATASLRLAHIHLGNDGGSERFLVRLVKALAERGVEQIAFVRPDRAWRAGLQRHCEVHEIRFRRSFPKHQFIRFHIGRTIRRFGASASLAWMNQAARWLPNPRPGMRTFVRLGDFPLTLSSFKYAERIIGNTPDVTRRCIEMGWPAERTHMISNFVGDVGQLPVDRRILDTPPEAFVVAAVGRFVPRKGFDLVVEAVARLDGVYLWLVGDGPELDSLRQLVAARGLSERVRLVGWQPSGLPYIKAADVVCCPSRQEPLGNVILESWAARRAVVATASEGPSWLIENDRTGLLTPLDAVGQLAKAIGLLKEDAALRASLAEAGAEELDARFSEEMICRSYIEYLTTPTASQPTR
jgi:glycosyltransferase involved in cell wall biosynthesis